MGMAVQGGGPAWRKSFWKSALGSMFHAMVSVMAVKIQLSSPRGVLRSVCLPGMRSMSSLLRPSCRSRLREQNQRSATCRAPPDGPPLKRTNNDMEPRTCKEWHCACALHSIWFCGQSASQPAN